MLIFGIRVVHLTRNLLKAPFSTHPFLVRRKIELLRAMAVPKSRKEPIIMKLNSPEFESIFTEELDQLSEIFGKYGYEIRIAGGAVRDLLMGVKPQDLDFATTATPTEMKEMFTKENVRMINTNGEKHGTITPRINDKENFEVTTLRVDIVTDGRHAQVQFTTDWLLDALRRDLTINSMFLSLDGEVYDYFYGYDDLKARKVRFVGDPVQRIQEDYLRILRYFRFYGRICETPDDHDEATLKAIIENKQGLANISGERIWIELKRMLEGNFAGDLLIRMIDCGLAPYIGLPESPNTEELKQVWAESGHLRLHPITLLSTLLKDEDDAATLNARLKLSVFERELAVFVVNNREPKLHEIPLLPYKQLVIKTKSKTSDIFKYVIEILKYNNSPHLDEFENWVVPTLPISGVMLRELGVESGRPMGIVLNHLKTLWVDSNFKLTETELLKYVPEILEKKANKR